MKIEVLTGIGTGPTKLAAFDAALVSMGVANYNLIRLSSVIPPGSKVVKSKKITKQPGKWGDRLYAVMADCRADSPNVEAWAGIGWIQDKKTGQGLFVEHEGASHATVEEDIRNSLLALMKSRNMKKSTANIQMTVNGIMCENKPVCALTIAVYQAQAWK